MNITISLNNEARLGYVRGANNNGYLGSLFLVRAFNERGHDVSIVHPNHLVVKNGRVMSRNVYSFNTQDGFMLRGQDETLEGSVFFVYSLGEDENNPEVSRQFMDLLYALENQYGHVINSAESTSYESKEKQKTLNLPWIPFFDVRSKKDLTEIVSSGEMVIAKPRVGLLGKGVYYLDKQTSEDMINSLNVSSYVFERFIPADEERRYIFINNKLVIKRKVGRTGHPGKERYSSVDLFGGIPEEIRLSRKIIRDIGMFYGSVDFRGDFVLEINGSGTGVAPPTIPGKKDPYNLSHKIVNQVERLQNGK